MRFLLDHDVPEDIEYALRALGHEVLKLRNLLPATASDSEVLHLASAQLSVLITCNRDDFLLLANRVGHSGIIILIRRRTRAQERNGLVRLLDNAGESGLSNNINFA